MAQRCPACNLMLTSTEVNAGACPTCKAPLGGGKRAGSSPRHTRSFDGSGPPAASPGRAKPSKKMNAASMTGLFVGIVIYAVLMAGPLKNAGLLPTFAVGFGAIMLCGLIGMGIGKLTSGD